MMMEALGVLWEAWHGVNMLRLFINIDDINIDHGCALGTDRLCVSSIANMIDRERHPLLLELRIRMWQLATSNKTF